MNWRDPKKELPKDGEKVFIMIEPHKFRGSLKDSLMSVEIVCGEVSFFRNKCIVENNDELGLGAVFWYLSDNKTDFGYTNAIAWLPIDELPLPNFY